MHANMYAKLLCVVTLAVTTTALSLPVAAQESSGAAVNSQSGAQTGAQSSPTAPASSDRRLAELFYQLQVLQQEVQELRGLVEEQNHHLNRLARDQQEQYIDLDRRVASLSSGTGLPAGATAGGNPAPGTTGSATFSTGGTTGSGSTGAGLNTQGTTGVGTSATGAATGGIAALPGTSAQGTERDAYQQAFDLMKGRQFAESIAAFNRLISNYPNGQYTPNAFYWLGELYLAQQATEEARQAFMQVVNLYPDHPKVPDTLYKLGVAYHRLGDVNRAMEYFGDVQTRYPQSSAAGLAASYAQEIR